LSACETAEENGLSERGGRKFWQRRLKRVD
jgi:hypothetical protein